MNGHVATTTRPTYHESKKQIRQEKINPKAASNATPNDSVVKPFIALISSVRMLVSIEVLRISYHPTCL
jgi:hypothetical protein